MRLLLCPECGLPFARIDGGRLVVQAHHRGQTHVCAIGILDLLVQNLADQADQIERQKQELAALRRAAVVKVEVRKIEPPERTVVAATEAERKRSRTSI